jgi:hypothetical protein
MERIKWIVYKSERIFSVDLSRTFSDKVIEDLLKEAVDIILNNPPKTILYLVNMQDAHLTPASMLMYKEAAKKVHTHLKGWAFYEMSLRKTIILDLLRQIIGLKAKVFETEEEAKEWLISIN